MQKAPMILVAAAGFLIAGIFVFLNSPGPCATIMEQTTQKLNLSVDVIKAKGALVIGGEKVQYVSEGARKVGEHLTACCIARHSDPPLPPDQYQACVNGAKDYEAKIIQITNIIKEGDKAKQDGNAQLAEQKATEAKTAVEASASIVSSLGKLWRLPKLRRRHQPIDNPKPWDQAKAIIKVNDNKSVTVDSNKISTDSFCGDNGLTLDYGQSIPFEKMQNFSVLDEKPTIEIVVLSGEHLSGRVDSSCSVYGSNEFGPFKTSIRNLASVDFGR